VLVGEADTLVDEVLVALIVEVMDDVREAVRLDVLVQVEVTVADAVFVDDNVVLAVVLDVIVLDAVREGVGVIDCVAGLDADTEPVGVWLGVGVRMSQLGLLGARATPRYVTPGGALDMSSTEGALPKGPTVLYR